LFKKREIAGKRQGTGLHPDALHREKSADAVSAQPLIINSRLINCGKP